MQLIIAFTDDDNASWSRHLPVSNEHEITQGGDGEEHTRLVHTRQ